MNIAFFSPSWPQSEKPNGIVTYLTILTTQLAQMGHQIYVVTPRLESADWGPGIVQIPRNDSNRFLASTFKKLLRRLSPAHAHYRFPARAIIHAFQRLIERHDIDIVEMEESFGWSYLVAKSLPIPVIVRLHGPHFLTGLGDQERLQDVHAGRVRREGRGIRAARAISAPSSNVLDSTLDFYSLRSRVITQVIPNPAKSEPSETKWSLEHCEPTEILFIGRFDKLKGADLVLKVFDRLSQDNDNLVLHFVGPDNGITAPSGSTIHWDQYLEGSLPRERLRNIQYHGALSPEDIAPLRKRCFVTLVFSRYETFSNTCVEAIATGCPVVATRVGGIPEIITSGYNGLLGDPEDVEGLRKQVQFLLDNPHDAAELGSNAWSHARQNFDPSLIAEQTVSFYEAVLSDEDNGPE